MLFNHDYYSHRFRDVESLSSTVDFNSIMQFVYPPQRHLESFVTGVLENHTSAIEEIKLHARSFTSRRPSNRIFLTPKAAHCIIFLVDHSRSRNQFGGPSLLNYFPLVGGYVNA